MGTWGPVFEINHVPPEWWGPFGAVGPALTLVDLVAGGILTVQHAAWLWTEVEQGRSVCIAAGPSGAGKTTILTCLVDAIPLARHRIYLRGMYETFAFRRQIEPDQAVLLVNEISPHLPVYCWGDAVRGVLQCARDGFQMLSTIHAATVKELVHQLAARPLRISPALISELGVVVFVDAKRSDEGKVERRVREFVRLSHDAEIGAVSAIAVDTDASRSAVVARRAEAIARMAGAAGRPSATHLRDALRAPSDDWHQP